VSEREQEYAGDYGYDLVHEEVRRPGAAEPTGRDDRPGSPSSRPGDEPAPDLGYDEAHGF
jgi:hypothetical protein